MPFYRRLTNIVTDTPIIVAAPAFDTGMELHLSERGVDPDAVLLVERGQVPVAGTPTLLVVDATGLITHSWIGVLDVAREAEVLEALGV